MAAVEVLVKLAAPDPWSFTVFDTLTRKFGHAEIVRVGRLKSWTLDFDLPEEAAFDATNRMLAETALIANPNRDVWCVRPAGDATLPGSMWRPSTESSDGFVVKVSDRDDIRGDAALRVVQSRLGVAGIVAVCFSTLWVLEITGGRGRASDLARNVAVATGWRRGLLSNPHFQFARVYGIEEYLKSEGGR